jgi:hypothetical protein
MGKRPAGNPDTAPHADSNWLDGGGTDLDNLVMLCRAHHFLVHESEWNVRLGTDRRPEFIPPKWIDPSQKPLRNRIHHLRV